VRRERAAGELVQRLGQSRVHSLALTGGENDDVERGGHRDGEKTAGTTAMIRQRMNPLFATGRRDQAALRR
jgi:hypothetical protein